MDVHPPASAASLLQLWGAHARRRDRHGARATYATHATHGHYRHHERRHGELSDWQLGCPSRGMVRLASLTLIEATLQNGQRHRLWVPDGWDYFVYTPKYSKDRLLFQRPRTAKRQSTQLEQLIDGTWRKVQIHETWTSATMGTA